MSRYSAPIGAVYGTRGPEQRRPPPGTPLCTPYAPWDDRRTPRPPGQASSTPSKRVFPVGARVSVSGTVQSNGWTVLAAGRSDHIRRTGSATRVKVRGQLGFVDVARLRFQLGAHGQVVAEVRFPRAFGSKLVRESAFTPNRTRVFALAIVRGSLQLLSLPR